MPLNQSRSTLQESEDSYNLLIQTWMRFVLAFTSLLVFFIDPIEAGSPSALAHLLMISYCLYSACFVFAYDLQLFQDLAAHRAAHWIDTVFFTALIALSAGSDSVFYFFYFLPILVASFSWGFKEGMRVAAASAILFTLAGFIVISPQHPYDLGEAVLRPITLLTFGYMIASFGRGRIILKRRLGLLQDISTHWNPRFGVNHTIMLNLGRLVEFYRGSHCILVEHRANLAPPYLMFTRIRHKSNTSEAPQEITQATANELLSLPNLLAVAYESPTARGIKGFNKYLAYDVKALDSTNLYKDECAALASLFDDESFISVPYQQQGITSGRIFLVAGNRAFSRADVEFIKQVSATLSSVIENMQLAESLIEEASGQERHRISLDVHDTTIQPYIALTLALDGLSRQFKANNQPTEKVDEIIQMANMTIQDLRSYKDNLREKSLMRGDVLLSAINNQASRLQRFYSIHVDVLGTVDPNLDGRIAEAAFQIIKEGLSNILRHTSAKNAFIAIESNDTQLHIDIGNETIAPASVKHFKPKSIYERTLSLNGEIMVETDVEGYTVIRVTIPLPPPAI